MKSAVAVTLASLFFSPNIFAAPYPFTVEEQIDSSDYELRSSGGIVESGSISWGYDSSLSFNLIGIAGLATLSHVYTSPGSHTTVAGSDPYTPTQTISWTVGSGQIGFDGVLDWNGGKTDFVVVWDVTSDGFTTTYAPVDVDGDGIIGFRLVNGAFQGYNLAVNAVTSVPEPESWGFMLSGLALVGLVSRRRKV